MDRGVKVAIFVASIVSLALGLIWDQVLSQARNAVQREIVDELGPEIMQANVGPPDVARLAQPEGFEAQAPATLPDPQQPAAEPAQEPETPAWQNWTEYTIEHGDSWWKLTHVTFKERGLSTKDLQEANPGVVTLRPGMKIMIPPLPGATDAEAPLRQASSPGGVAGYPTPPPVLPPQPEEYTVQGGDSWWHIAHEVHKVLGKSTKEWRAANPDVGTLRPGMKINIPR